MKGLLLKDLYVITKQLKIFLIIIPVIAIAGGLSLSTMAILFGAVLPMTAIAYDERSKWNELAAMMPYSKNELVFSKYLLGYVCIIVATLLVIFGQVILQILRTNNSGGSIDILLFGICIALIFIAINTPILFKFGSEKGRFLFIIVMGLIGAFSTFINETNNILITLQNVSPLAILLGIILLNFVSIQISLKININEK